MHQKQSYWRRSTVFIVNLEQISHCSGVTIIDFEQVNTALVSIKGNRIV